MSEISHEKLDSILRGIAKKYLIHKTNMLSPRDPSEAQTQDYLAYQIDRAKT